MFLSTFTRTHIFKIVSVLFMSLASWGAYSAASSTNNSGLQIILLGAPGAGKGTQGELLAEKYNIPKISTGDMLRAAIAEKTELGKEVESVMNAGKLVSDDIIVELIKNRIKEDDAKNGFILDGFPRTIKQAEAIKKEGIDINLVLVIDAPENEIINRLSGRRVHLSSGRVYHIEHNPPKVANTDDVTGEPLTHREDDKEATILARLRVYREQTQPLINWYDAEEKNTDMDLHLVSVNATGNVQEIQKKILTKLDAIGL